jgi:hypothetical protein
MSSLGTGFRFPRAELACHVPPAHSHHRDALDFDQNSGVGKVGHRDQGAARKLSVWKHFMPDLDEPVAVTRIIDRDRHSDEIGELAAHAIERPVDEREAGPRLGFEIVHDRFSVQIGEGGLTCQPDDLAALRDDGRRESA